MSVGVRPFVIFQIDKIKNLPVIEETIATSKSAIRYAIRTVNAIASERAGDVIQNKIISIMTYDEFGMYIARLRGKITGGFDMYPAELRPDGVLYNLAQQFYGGV